METLGGFALIAIAILVVYVLWARKKAGMQPGEETINRLIGALDKSNATTQAAVEANKVQAAVLARELAKPQPAPVPPPYAAEVPATPVRTDAIPAEYVPHPESNTPDWRRWTDLSPGGFPVWYATLPDGAGGYTVVESIPPMLIADGERHQSENDIAVYRSRLAARKAIEDELNMPQPLAGPVDGKTLGDDDWAYVVAMAGAPQGLIGNMTRAEYSAQVARFTGGGDKYNPYKYTNAWRNAYRGPLYP